MLNRIMLWQSMIGVWAHDRITGQDDDAGASLVEYSLLLALIAVVAIAALTYLGVSVSHTINNVANVVNNP